MFEIRRKLLRQTDATGENLLHMAARLGDKYFSVMIVNEAKELGCLDEIINEKNNEGHTPFYLLCEQGFRSKDSKLYTLEKWTDLNEYEAPF